jgi:hypothetical protein
MIKMRKVIFIGGCLAILLGCKSSQKLVEEGNYDRAIEKSIKSILKGKYDVEDVLMLDKAYSLANTRDLERIKLLKAEGKPENWEQIYFVYIALDNRQKQVRKATPVNAKGKVYDYKQIDYTNSIVEAKTKAAEYYYDNGKRKMDLGTKEAYRQSYYSFNKAKKYRGSAFPDIDILIKDSKYFGTSRVMVDAVNTTPFKLPPDYFTDLLTINTSQLNHQWVEYYLGNADRNVEYDYYVTILLKNIAISPQRFTQKEYIRKKEVQDGFTYVLDNRGNVMKDSLGNDIKVPRYKELTCTVVERRQIKEATVEAQIEYLELFPNKRVVKLVPVSATSIFEHFSGRALGDLEALTNQDMQLIEQKAIAFPDDLSMIYDCNPILRQAISDAMKENRNLIR